MVVNLLPWLLTVLALHTQAWAAGWTLDRNVKGLQVGGARP